MLPPYFLFFFSPSDRRKTSWWEKKISSPTKIDSVAARVTLVSKDPGPIPFGLTSKGWKKPRPPAWKKYPVTDPGTALKALPRGQ